MRGDGLELALAAPQLLQDLVVLHDGVLAGGVVGIEDALGVGGQSFSGDVNLVATNYFIVQFKSIYQVFHVIEGWNVRSASISRLCTPRVMCWTDCSDTSHMT